MKYLVILLRKDAGAGVSDIALINFKIVEAGSPNEALSKWKEETVEEKVNPDSWYKMSMNMSFIRNNITTSPQGEYKPSIAGLVFMNLDDENTYDFIVVELDTISPGKEYSFLATVADNANYNISY